MAAGQPGSAERQPDGRGPPRERAASEVTSNLGCVSSRPDRASVLACPSSAMPRRVGLVGSVIKKRRKRMAKKKHRKLLKKTRIQRWNKK